MFLTILSATLSSTAITGLFYFHNLLTLGFSPQILLVLGLYWNLVGSIMIVLPIIIMLNNAEKDVFNKVEKIWAINGLGFLIGGFSIQIYSISEEYGLIFI